MIARKKVSAVSAPNDAGRKIKLLTYVIIAYLVLGLVWWSYLLYTKNQDAFLAKAELLRVGMVAEGIYDSEESFQAHPRYLELKQKYKRQEMMILGEAGLLVLTMSIGIWLMNRGFLKEIQLAKQKRNFLLSITHELKSPLAAIRLALDTIKRRPLERDKVELLTGNGIKDTERLKKLVDNLLLAAKMEDRFETGKEPQNLTDIAKGIINELILRHEDTEITLDAPPKVIVEVDKQSIQIMLSNLIENGIKYSYEIKSIGVKIHESNETVSISVMDEGIGIPDEEKDHIFDKFYRVGSEDTRTTKGTGLGLYIVKGIVNAHKGQINVTDNIPRGTVFNITLPKT